MQNNKMACEYMNLGQTAVYLGVSRPTLKRLLRSGLKYAKVADGAYRISKTWCDEYMTARLIQTRARAIVNDLFD